MSGVYATIEAEGLTAATAALNALGSGRARELLPQVGGLVESQTRERFQTKTAPDGAPWAAWSPAYAGSRRHGQSLLVAEGHLRDSIEWRVEGEAVHVGSNLVYAAVHQGGSSDEAHEVGAYRGRHRSEFDGPNERTYHQVKTHKRTGGIPARPYLGVSEANLTEISAEIEAWVRGITR